MRKTIFILALISSLQVWGQSGFRTQIFQPNIKTLQVTLLGEKMGLPIVELNSSDVLHIRFDEMSHVAHSYSYRVLHCNADWTLSGINSNEYLSGFTTSAITDYTLSSYTILYAHYSFNLPNADMNFKISGNYVVQIYEDNMIDKPIAQACFSVLEPRVAISGKVRGNTDTELNGKLQQLDFELGLNGYPVRDVNSEIKVVVRQNNRIDNQVTAITPTIFRLQN
jgi:hypothetical protein